MIEQTRHQLREVDARNHHASRCTVMVRVHPVQTGRDAGRTIAGHAAGVAKH